MNIETRTQKARAYERPLKLVLVHKNIAKHTTRTIVNQGNILKYSDAFTRARWINM